MINPHPVQVIAVTGGKGGVGKSNVSINLSMALADLGQKVVLMDADLGLANIDVLLGLSAGQNIGDVLSGDCSLADVLVEGPKGIRIVPASSGTQQLTQLGPLEHAGLISAFSELSHDIDVLIIDTAAGISEQVITFLRAAHEILIVVCDEPTSITDAYALIKVLNTQNDLFRFRILANMVRSEQEGHQLHDKLSGVSERFLEVALQYVGCIPFDESLRKAVKLRKPLLEVYPRSKSALAFRQLATTVKHWPLPTSPRGNLEFFIERLAHSS